MALQKSITEAKEVEIVLRGFMDSIYDEKEAMYKYNEQYYPATE